MIIQVNIADKYAAATGAPVIVCGNSDYLVAFTFDDEWADITEKTARFSFVKDGAIKYIDVEFSGSEAPVPVLSGITSVEIGVFGGELRTTTGARVPCVKSILCPGGTRDEQNAAGPLMEDSFARALFSNALKGSGSGVTVSASDVSPVQHPLKVSVESKNLFSTKYYAQQYCTANHDPKFEQNNSFSFESALVQGQASLSFDIYLEKGTYYLSGADIVASDSTCTVGYGVFKGNAQVFYTNGVTSIGRAFTITEADTYRFNFYGSYGNDVGTIYTFSNIQLEKGTAKTDFTPYISDLSSVTVSKLVDGTEVQSVTASSDGTVEGLVSSSPAMEIKTSAEDGSVLLDVEYNRDLNKIIAALEAAILNA